MKNIKLRILLLLGFILSTQLVNTQVRVIDNKGTVSTIDASKWTRIGTSNDIYAKYPGNVGIGITSPAASLHNAGSTILGMIAVTNNQAEYELPATYVDNYSGVVVTQENTASSITLPAPTNKTVGRLFSISSASTSTFPFTILGTGYTILPGQSGQLVWNGIDWSLPSAFAASASNIFGDVSGTLGAASVDKLKGKAISIGTLGAGNVLQYDGTNWVNWSPNFLTLSSLSATAPLSYNNTTGAFSISQATTSTDGYLVFADWNKFNNKVSSVTAGSSKVTVGGTATAPTVDVNTANLGTIALATGTTGTAVNVGSAASLGGTLTLNIPFASAAGVTGGLIGKTDYDAFAAKQAAISLTTTGTSGNATFSANTLNIPNYTYTLPVATGSTLGGVIVGSGLNVTAGTISTVNNGTVTSFSAGDLSPLFTTTESTTTTTPALSFTLTNAGANTLFGNNTASSAAPAYFAATALPVAGDVSGTLGSASVDKLKGKAISIGTLGAGNVLQYDGTNWVNWAPNFLTLSSLSATAPLSYNNTTGAFSISQATTSTDGYMVSADWNKFNNKVSSVTAGSSKVTVGGTATAPTVDVNTANLGTIALATGTTGTGVNVSGSPASLGGTLTLNIPFASATGVTGGLIGKTDYDAFTAKQAAISLTTTGTSGNATFSANTLNIPNYTYTLPAATGSTLGGVIVGSGLNVTAGTISTVNNGTVTSFSAGDLSPLFTTTESTTTTTPALSFALTNAGANTLFGNNTASSAAPAYFAATALPVAGDVSGTLGSASVDKLKGKAISIGTLGAGNVLQYDGTNWVNWAPNFLTLTSLSATAPLTYNNGTGAFGITQATTSTDGYLSSAYWNTFNNKVTSLTAGSSKVTIGGTTTVPTVDVNTANLGTITLATGTTGTSANVSGSPASLGGTLTLNIPFASAAGVTGGLIGKTDYDAFTAKQAAISLTTTGTSGNATFSANTLNIPNYTYTLPAATGSTLGGVMVGAGLALNSGTISTVNNGTVTSFSAGDLTPLFTTTEATTTTTPALSFALTNAGANTIFGNNTASSAAPSYFSPILSSPLFANQGTASTVLHGNVSGNPSWGAISLTTDISGLLAVANGGTGISTAATPGAVLYGSSATALGYSAAGTSGQVLVSGGTGAPSWTSAPTGITIPISKIALAAASNTIDNTNYAQTWNWSTATTQYPLTLTGNTLTTASLLSLTGASTLTSGSLLSISGGITASTTKGLLNIQNTAASTTGTVATIQANSTAGTGLTVLANGSVGIGTAAPGSTLEVKGAAVNTAPTLGTTATIDFSTNNLAYTSYVAASPAFTLSNMKAGGAYTLVLTGTTNTGTATFTAAGFTVKYMGTSTMTTAKTHIYSFIVVGTYVFVTMATEN